MYYTAKETADFAKKFKVRNPDQYDVDILLCPPAVNIPVLVDILKDTRVHVGAQNLHQEVKGAYTGETAAEMITGAGANYVLIGHSERRQYFHETNELVRAKTIRALDASLTPVVCIGETLDERESGKMKDVILTQLGGAFKDFTEEMFTKVVIAYEPVWAIGTGRTASPDQAQEVHRLIRLTIQSQFGEKAADKTRILYGGSVKVENARDLLSQEDIDGALIGGASLKVEDFTAIIEIAHNL